VYVQPSRREGRSLAMLEAMAAALPTVAQGLPAMGEIHVHDQTALLVPPSEKPDFAPAIARLLEDAALRARMGRSARDHVQAFSVATMAHSYADLYRDILGELPPLRAVGGVK
jgi:glycosyltransferase involved in cell wall biosynthesis